MKTSEVSARISIAERSALMLNNAILMLFAFVCLYPFYYILINSLSSNTRFTVALLPHDFSFEAYRTIFQTSGVFRSMWISTLRTVTGSALTVVCSGFVAFLFTQKDLPFRKLIYRLFIVTMYVSAGFIPFFLLISNLGLRNNFLVYIVPSTISAFFVILVKTYIETIPAALQESAELDGAGILTIYFKIVFPLCLPILACIAVFSAVNHWNSWVDTLWFITDPRLVTLQFRLWQLLQTNMGDAVRAGAIGGIGTATRNLTPTTLRMAMTFFTALPILCVYPIMQKYFVKGIMLGAVKG